MNSPRFFHVLAAAVTVALLAVSVVRAEEYSPVIKLVVPTAGAPIEIKASFYSEECRGLLMANGRPFNPDRLTCASWDYPLGATLEITSGGRSVHVTVTDRGPAKRLVARGVVIDLTRAAFERLGDLDRGHLPVEIRRLD